MKVTKLRGVTISAFIVCGSLLFSGASCCFFKNCGPCGVKEQAVDTSVTKDAVIAHQAGHTEEGGFVANPFCYACHANFEGENLVTKHEKAGVGCERCHGESERHRSDEANVTPPELMYPRNRIIPMCMICHPRDAIKHVGAHMVILEGASTVFDEEEPKGPAKVCTDCHAKNHKMSVRIVRWNKATGEVIKGE